MRSWLLAPLAGVALGFAALRDVGGEAVPPAATLAIAITVLGVLDATAGFVAVLIFATGVIALGASTRDTTEPGDLPEPSFVLLSLPGFVLSLLQLFGREGDEPRIGWGKRIAGVGLLAILAALGLLL